MPIEYNGERFPMTIFCVKSAFGFFELPSSSKSGYTFGAGVRWVFLMSYRPFIVGSNRVSVG